MLATLVEQPFDQKGWLFETKWDGYRALAHKNGQVQLKSRGQKSFNARFPTIVVELKKLRMKCVLDGEIVIFDEKKHSNFQLLQNYQTTRKGTPYYYVFDILSLGGKSLTRLPLIDRKKILKKLLSQSGIPHIKFSQHVLTKGKAFFKKAIKKGWEGIVAKRCDSPYQFRRSTDWQKIKTTMRQEVVIGGFTAPRGGRKRFGALLVGVYERGKLRYVGHVGGGFNEKLLEDVYKKLKRAISEKCPFSVQPHPNSPVKWTRPSLVCEVAFSEWTHDGKMRQPIFKGMRIDKPARQVVREKAKRVAK